MTAPTDGSQRPIRDRAHEAIELRRLLRHVLNVALESEPNAEALTVARDVIASRLESARTVARAQADEAEEAEQTRRAVYLERLAKLQEADDRLGMRGLYAEEHGLLPSLPDVAGVPADGQLERAVHECGELTRSPIKRMQQWR